MPPDHLLKKLFRLGSMPELLPAFEVLKHIDQGVTIFDRNLFLVASNPIFRELMQFPPSLVQPGTPMEKMIRHNAERGEYGEGDVEILGG